MLEKFKLKSCPTVIILKIISFLLSLAVIATIFFAFYPVPENYDTEADVKQSRSFDAIVDATMKILIQEFHNNDALLVQQTFIPYKISWIYEASINGYNIYSKIDYAIGFSGESKTAFCKTWCGEIWSRTGVNYGISTEIISESEYGKHHSRFISSEQEYNNLAISTVYWAIKAKL